MKKLAPNLRHNAIAYLQQKGYRLEPSQSQDERLVVVTHPMMPNTLIFVGIREQDTKSIPLMGYGKSKKEKAMQSRFVESMLSWIEANGNTRRIRTDVIILGTSKGLSHIMNTTIILD